MTKYLKKKILVNDLKRSINGRIMYENKLYYTLSKKIFLISNSYVYLQISVIKFPSFLSQQGRGELVFSWRPMMATFGMVGGDDVVVVVKKLNSKTKTMIVNRREEKNCQEW